MTRSTSEGFSLPCSDHVQNAKANRCCFILFNCSSSFICARWYLHALPIWSSMHKWYKVVRPVNYQPLYAWNRSNIWHIAFIVSHIPMYLLLRSFERVQFFKWCLAFGYGQSWISLPFREMFIFSRNFCYCYCAMMIMPKWNKLYHFKMQAIQKPFVCKRALAVYVRHFERRKWEFWLVLWPFDRAVRSFGNDISLALRANFMIIINAI